MLYLCLDPFISNRGRKNNLWMGKTETERKCTRERCWWKQNGGNINWSPSSCVEGYGDDSPSQVPCPLWLWAWNNVAHCGIAASPFSHHLPQPPTPCLSIGPSHTNTRFIDMCTLSQTTNLGKEILWITTSVLWFCFWQVRRLWIGSVEVKWKHI